MFTLGRALRAFHQRSLLRQLRLCRITTIPDCEYLISADPDLCHFIPSHTDLPRGLAEHSHRSELATNILNTMKADLTNFLDIPSSHDILIMQGVSILESLTCSGLTVQRRRICPVCRDGLQYYIDVDREAEANDTERVRDRV